MFLKIHSYFIFLFLGVQKGIWFTVDELYSIYCCAFFFTWKEPLWQCEKDCLSNMYSLPELRHDEMHKIWNDLKTCGDPCGCNWNYNIQFVKIQLKNLYYSSEILENTVFHQLKSDNKEMGFKSNDIDWCY